MDIICPRQSHDSLHPTDFNQLLEVLKKNRNNVSVDPSDRKTQEMLEKQFIKSISNLEPLKARIFKTDELIDEIVDRLYGLTEEDIKIVRQMMGMVDFYQSNCDNDDKICVVSLKNIMRIKR
ncbi:MAG: hypothetical protein CV087_12640 [Candidatus Brocadia sp. WS118]|nr:MAG: hypothetical protein CV087_12640 [Candidatus Brocadia sp. WS118]